MLRSSLASLVALSLPGVVLAQSDTEFSWPTSYGQQLTNLVDSFPACGHTLPWIWRTRIRLDFDTEVTVPPAGSIEIREMLPGGALGVVDHSSAFLFSLDRSHDHLLWIEETGDESVLSDRTWYAVVHDGGWPGVFPFTLAYLVRWGDANDDGRVSSADVSYVSSVLCELGFPCLPRADINGDGRISSADVSYINSFLHGKTAIRLIPMPEGHRCGTDEEPLVALADSEPACGHTLPWMRRGRIRLDFDVEVTLPPAGSIEIREMLPGGALGVEDFSSAFAFSFGYRDERLLWIEETGDESVLSDRTWYAVVHDGGWPGVAPFTLAYLVRWGDVNDDGRVSSADVSLANRGCGIAGCPRGDRGDITGDGRVTSADISFINFFIHGKFAVRLLPMPDGHGCSAP